MVFRQSGQRVNQNLNGNDVIINLDSGNTITLKDSNKEMIDVGGFYANFGNLSINGNTAVLNSTYSGTFKTSYYSANPQNIDASACTYGDIRIYGDDRANIIKAGTGNKYYGTDIYAGKGDDIIYLSATRNYNWGSANADDNIYYYKGDGNDTIYNYKTGDDIYLYDGVKFKNVTLSGNDVIINLDTNNTITLV